MVGQLKMHLDSENRYLDKVGQMKMSKFFINNFNGIDLFLGHLDTKMEEHIGEIKSIGLPAK